MSLEKSIPDKKVASLNKKNRKAKKIETVVVFRKHQTVREKELTTHNKDQFHEITTQDSPFLHHQHLAVRDLSSVLAAPYE